MAAHVDAPVGVSAGWCTACCHSPPTCAPAAALSTRQGGRCARNDALLSICRWLLGQLLCCMGWSGVCWGLAVWQEGHAGLPCRLCLCCISLGERGDIHKGVHHCGGLFRVWGVCRGVGAAVAISPGINDGKQQHSRAHDLGSSHPRVVPRRSVRLKGVACVAAAGWSALS
jgi:hypothetical protein